jgi:damage-control phosphatase, subfamily I
MAGADEAQQYDILHQVIAEVQDFPPDHTPPEMAYRIHQIVHESLGNGNPYQPAKEASTQHALSIYPELRAMVAASDDPLDTAVRVAIAGNIIDMGVTHDYDLDGALDRLLHAPFAIDHMPQFRQAVAANGEILYLGDNAGETVFDRVLIEALDVPVTYVVRGGPIINDATRQDAIAAGLDHAAAAIIDSGAAVPGTILELCSPEFQHRFHSAHLIIAKGQGNYESLSGSGAPVFFALQAKCPVIAADLGVPLKSFVLKSEQE